MESAPPDTADAPHTVVAAAVTWLFVPASRPDRFAKALRSGADVVVIDLEDSVSAADKEGARETLMAAWPGGAGSPGTAPSAGTAVVVRVNDRRTAEFAADAAACRVLRPAAIVLPKAESAHDVRSAAEAGLVPVLPLIETARGLVNLQDIASCPESVRLLFGTVDLALDLGVTGDTALDPARSDLVRWSVACSLPPPVDGVTTAIRDAAAATRDATRAKEWGFGGKLCVHPAQIPLVDAAFAPGAAELEWARGVLAVQHEGAAVRDGEMIDRPVVERARRIMRRAERRGRETG